MQCCLALWLAIAIAQQNVDEPDESTNTNSVERVLRSYDIGFLTAAIPQFPAREQPDVRSPTLALAEEEDVAIAFGQDAFGDDQAPSGLSLSPDSIVALIRQNIAEDSWANKKNSIQADEAELAVVQTRTVHDQIARLLEALRARRARMITVDVALVPTAALGPHAAETSPWLPEASFDEVLERAGEGGERFTLTAYNDQLVSCFHGRRRATVWDVEVNQTGVLPVRNVRIVNLPIGITLEVEPRLVEGTGWLTVNLALTRLQNAGEVEKRDGVFYEIEYIPLREEALQTTLLLKAGQVALAGSFRASADPDAVREYAVLLRAHPIDVERDVAPAPGEDREFELRVYDVGFLLASLPNQESPPYAPHLLHAWIEENVDPDSWRDDRTSLEVGEETLLVTARADTHAQIRRWLDERLRERGRLFTVDLREFVGPLEAILELQRTSLPGLQLAEGWQQSAAGRRLRLAFRAGACNVLGNRFRARGIDVRSYLQDVEVVSGGTGFQIQSMPDPIVGVAGDGFVLEAVARQDLRSESLSLTLDYSTFRTRFDRQAVFLAPVELRTTPDQGQGPQGEEQPSDRPRLVSLPFQIDLPEQTEHTCRIRSSVPLDRDVISKIRKSGGEARLFVVRVHLSQALGEGR